MAEYAPDYSPVGSLPTHSPRRLVDPAGWVIYLSHDQPDRLVVFVHGFRGDAVDTWQHFPDAGQTSDWWRRSDLLFVGYPSHRDDITATAFRLRTRLPTFFPALPEALVRADDLQLRDLPQLPYSQLVLVGHSLGGVVVRRALCDAARNWVDDGTNTPRPSLLCADVRLFSPATAGFQPSGVLGMVKASPSWGMINMFLRRSSAFTDLQCDSDVLVSTRRRTEALVRLHPIELRGLKARIVWANPDNVVVTEEYDCDRAGEAIDGASHMTVCKPRAGYHDPWRFVEHGCVR